MKNNNRYKCLDRQVYSCGDYSLAPIRYEDRYSIMNWRNEQIYHLRQKNKITKLEQDSYFQTVINPLFENPYPDQILFSYLYNKNCVGYGGLVHINYEDKNSELSFIIDTNMEKEGFEYHWGIFLELIEQVAFYELGLYKIFTYAYDLRPRLYDILEKKGYKREATLLDHLYYNNEYFNIIIHTKLNKELVLRNVKYFDCLTLFDWANNPYVRLNSFNKNKIKLEEHSVWLQGRLGSKNCNYYLLMDNGNNIGSIRFDIDKDSNALINYLVDPLYHGGGYGKKILKLGLEKVKRERRINKFIGFVKHNNIASIKIFNNLGFIEVGNNEGVLKFERL